MATSGFPPDWTYERYRDYIDHSPVWHRIAMECKRRAGFRCSVCALREELEVHHNSYEHLGDEWPEDLVCLCADCHALFSYFKKLLLSEEVFKEVQGARERAAAQHARRMRAIFVEMCKNPKMRAVFANQPEVYSRYGPIPQECLAMNLPLERPDR
jgi:hypothetical protein